MTLSEADISIKDDSYKVVREAEGWLYRQQQNGREKWHYASKWDVEIHRDTKKWSQNSEKVNYTYSPLKERSLVCGLSLARYRGTLTMLQKT